MTINHFLLLSLAGTLVGLTISGILIYGSILLLRERHSSNWLMLAGAIVTALSRLSSPVVQFLGARNMITFNEVSLFLITSMVPLVGMFLFASGFFLHALRQNQLLTHIQKLETILNSERPR